MLRSDVGGEGSRKYRLKHRHRRHGGAIVDEELRQLRAKTTLPGFAKWPAEFREVSMGYMATNPEGLKRWLEIHQDSRQTSAPVQLERTKITFEKLSTIRVPTLLMPGD